jgi:hypothetical protein
LRWFDQPAIGECSKRPETAFSFEDRLISESFHQLLYGRLDIIVKQNLSYDFCAFAGVF